MPTEQRRSMAPFRLPLVSESSFFTDEFRLRPESQVGVLKQGCFPENYVWGNKPVASSPLETLKPIGAKVVDQSDNLRPYKLMAQKTSFVEDKLLDKTRHFELPPSCWRDGQDPALQRDSFTKALAFPLEGRRGNFNGTQNEKELFTSSLPDIFDKKIRLTPNSAVSGQLAEKVNLNNVDDEPFELTKEIEAQIIGNLLPDDDDLLSGVVDGVGYTTQTNNQDDIDDIFYTGGGMELEGNDNSKLSEVNGGVNNGQTIFSGHFIGEHKYEGPPSRTLLVRNIDSNVEDYELKLIFERYGDICTLYTDSKHHGFVMISYYDVRSSENALKSLQGKLLGCRKLDICYSNPKGYTLEKDYNLGTLVLFDLDPSVTSNDLHQIFVSYGEIKEIAENGNKKFIVFYDVRAAEAARRALNRSDILEKRARMERSYSGATNRVMQQMSHELEQKRFGVCRLGNPSHPPSTCFGSVNMAPIMSPGPENGTVRNLSSRVQAPTNQFREGRFLDLPSTTIKTISSPVGITSAGTQSSRSTHAELSHSLGTMNEHTNGHINYGFQESTFPHSLPESQNGLNNDIPYNLSTITPSGTVEAMFSRHIYKGVSGNLNTNSSGHIDALDFSRVGSCPLHNHQLAQNYSYDLHHQPSSRMLWPRASPFINNVPSRPLAQVHGISTPPQVPESILPINHHQVGSAPAVHPPNWDRRRGYPGEIIEASGFLPGSAGSMGFPGSPQLHELELNRVFSQTGGAFMEPMSPVHMGTPRQRGHMFHGRSRMISHPSSFDSPGERMRSRRNESGANQSDDRRQFDLDVQRIARGEDTRTTLMIKNIPNKYTSKMLLSAIDETHKGTYDFIYLPIDFKNRCNVGYAFINIISPEKIIPFYKTFNGKRWDKFNSEKVASLAYARIQGKSALIAHFQNSSLMNEDKRCRPMLFHSDGPNAGDQEPFPVGTNVRTRPGRASILGWEENGTPQRGGETPGSTTVA